MLTTEQFNEQYGERKIRIVSSDKLFTFVKDQKNEIFIQVRTGMLPIKEKIKIKRLIECKFEITAYKRDENSIIIFDNSELND